MARQQRSGRSAPRRLCHRPAAAAGGTVDRPARRARAARRTAEGQGQIQGQGGLRPRLQRQDRRDRGDGVAAGFRSEQSEGGARSRSHQPPDHRRLRDGLDLQGADAGDGAGFRQGQSQHAVRRARRAALRQVHHSRHPSARPLDHAVGSVHLLLQRRRGADRAGAGRRGAQGVPEQARPARPAAHRTARKRLADRAEALERTQHHHHRLRSRHRGGAAAGGDGHQRRASTAAT